MSDCVNLLQRFGHLYRIGFDPAYDAKGRKRSQLDPWCTLLCCERGGVIYPYGRTLLAVEVEGRPIIARRLRSLACVKAIQEGDGFAAFTFDVADFDTIAAIVRPRRKRTAGPHLTDVGRKTRFKSRHTEHPQRSQTHAEVPT